MPKNVTIKDIAAEAGVSIALVSFVMNNRIGSDGKQKYRVSPATRDRILEVSKRLNYRPNSAARTLRSGRSKVIGAILSDISNVFYGEIARYLEKTAYRYGYTVLFGSTDERKEKLDRLVHSFMDKGVEGFVIVPCEGSEKSLKYIMDAGIPLVVMDRNDIKLPVPKVVLNNRDAMKRAVGLLVRNGVRKIEMLSYKMKVSTITDREEGYIESMAELGCQDCAIRIHRLPFDATDAAVDEILPPIVAGGVEGLVFATNSLTVAAIKKLFAMNVRVQKDICLVGFDYSNIYYCFKPQIPYVKQPMRTICRYAIETLMELISGGGKSADSEIVFEGEVVGNIKEQ